MSDFAEMRKEAYRRRNELNRQRGRAYETRIMKKLRGKRVPMSGSGALKGDGMVYDASNRLYLVECKTREQYHPKTYRHFIRIDFKWLTKVAQEVIIMRACYGVLVFHFHGMRGDYVIIEETWFRKFLDALVLDVIDVPVLPVRVKSNSIMLFHEDLERVLRACDSTLNCARIYGPHVPYILVRLEDFIAMTSNTSLIDETDEMCYTT